jgi:hypothetical protein
MSDETTTAGTGEGRSGDYGGLAGLHHVTAIEPALGRYR